MSAGRHDPSRGSESDSRSRDRSRGFVSACLGCAIAVLIAGGWEGSTVLVVAVGLVGASFGALLSIVVSPPDDDPSAWPATDAAPPRFHRLAAAVALGIAAVILLFWGVVLEAVLPGYGAALSVGLLSYALLASALPKW